MKIFNDSPGTGKPARFDQTWTYINLIFLDSEKA